MCCSKISECYSWSSPVGIKAAAQLSIPKINNKLRRPIYKSDYMRERKCELWKGQSWEKASGENGTKENNSSKQTETEMLCVTSYLVYQQSVKKKKKKKKNWGQSQNVLILHLTWTGLNIRG